MVAGGVELSALSTTPKQALPSQTFVTKITKAFLDAVYAFLDGLVLLASNEAPIVNDQPPSISSMGLEGLNSLGSLDLKDGVCPNHKRFSLPEFDVDPHVCYHRTRDYCLWYPTLRIYPRWSFPACFYSSRPRLEYRWWRTDE